MIHDAHSRRLPSASVSSMSSNIDNPRNTDRGQQKQCDDADSDNDGSEFSVQNLFRIPSLSSSSTDLSDDDSLNPFDDPDDCDSFIEDDGVPPEEDTDEENSERYSQIASSTLSPPPESSNLHQRGKSQNDESSGNVRKRENRDHVKATEVSRRFICDHCDSTFTGKQPLQSHIVKYHIEHKPRVGFEYLQCHLCGERFRKEECRQRHIQKFHVPKEERTQKKKLPTIKKSIENSRTVKTTERMKPRCEHCSKTFNTDLQLTEHIKFTHMQEALAGRIRHDEKGPENDCRFPNKNSISIPVPRKPRGSIEEPTFHPVHKHGVAVQALACSHCLKGFRTARQLELHLNVCAVRMDKAGLEIKPIVRRSVAQARRLDGSLKRKLLELDVGPAPPKHVPVTQTHERPCAGSVKGSNIPALGAGTNKKSTAPLSMPLYSRKRPGAGKDINVLKQHSGHVAEQDDCKRALKVAEEKEQKVEALISNNDDTLHLAAFYEVFGDCKHEPFDVAEEIEIDTAPSASMDHLINDCVAAESGHLEMFEGKAFLVAEEIDVESFDCFHKEEKEQNILLQPVTDGDEKHWW